MYKLKLAQNQMDGLEKLLTNLQACFTVQELEKCYEFSSRPCPCGGECSGSCSSTCTGGCSGHWTVG